MFFLFPWFWIQAHCVLGLECKHKVFVPIFFIASTASTTFMLQKSYIYFYVEASFKVPGGQGVCFQGPRGLRAGPTGPQGAFRVPGSIFIIAGLEPKLFVFKSSTQQQSYKAHKKGQFCQQDWPSICLCSKDRDCALMACKLVPKWQKAALSGILQIHFVIFSDRHLIWTICILFQIPLKAYMPIYKWSDFYCGRTNKLTNRGIPRGPRGSKKNTNSFNVGLQPYKSLCIWKCQQSLNYESKICYTGGTLAQILDILRPI